MKRQEFIDGCLMSSAAAWVTDAPALLKWINEVADERAKHHPFDDLEQSTLYPWEKATLYPWGAAPTDAMWATTNHDGRIEWWREKPTWDGILWWTTWEARCSFIRFGDRLYGVTDLKNSLEKRPQ